MISNYSHVAVFHETIFNFLFNFYAAVRNYFFDSPPLTISLLFTVETFYETANKGELNKMGRKRRNKKFQRTKKLETLFSIE